MARVAGSGSSRLGSPLAASFRCRGLILSASFDAVAVWTRLGAIRGQISVTELASEIGWSTRRFRTRFRSQIGLSPKQAARLWRFRHVTHLLVDRPEMPLADVPVRCGFFDRSHLANGVQAMSGLTVSEIRSHGRGGVFQD